MVDVYYVDEGCTAISKCFMVSRTVVWCLTAKVTNYVTNKPACGRNWKIWKLLARTITGDVKDPWVSTKVNVTHLISSGVGVLRKTLLRSLSKVWWPYLCSWDHKKRAECWDWDKKTWRTLLQDGSFNKIMIQSMTPSWSQISRSWSGPHRPQISIPLEICSGCFQHQWNISIKLSGYLVFVLLDCTANTNIFYYGHFHGNIRSLVSFPFHLTFKWQCVL